MNREVDETIDVDLDKRTMVILNCPPQHLLDR